MGRRYDGHRICSSNFQQKLAICSRVAHLLAAEEDIITNESTEAPSNIHDHDDEATYMDHHNSDVQHHMDEATYAACINSPVSSTGRPGLGSSSSTRDVEWSDEDESYFSSSPPTACSYEDNDDLNIFGFWDDATSDRITKWGSNDVLANPLPEDNLPGVASSQFGNGIMDQPEFTIPEIAMIDLLTLCDSSGARHGLYDDILTMLQCHSTFGELDGE